MTDVITQVRSDKETNEILRKSGLMTIPRLNRGLHPDKKSGRPVEITRHLFDVFRLRHCPDCGDGEKFIIFKFVCVCITCGQFYWISKR